MISSLFLIGCANYLGYYKIFKNKNGEPILNADVNYTFTEKPNEEGLTKIDTTAYYIQVFEGRYYNQREKQNPQVLIFHSDGFFKSTSVNYFLNFENRKKNSIYYGGKYRIKEINSIELEQFYPSKGGRTNYYSRNIIRGNIDRNKIIFDDGQSPIKIFEKRYDLK